MPTHMDGEKGVPHMQQVAQLAPPQYHLLRDEANGQWAKC